MKYRQALRRTMQGNKATAGRRNRPDCLTIIKTEL